MNGSEQASAAKGKADVGLPPWKRGLDLFCVLLASPVLVPLWLLISLMVKLVSRGPVLFCQPRIGYRGQSFTCLKFRTMRIGADKKVHETYFKRLIHSKEPMTKLDNYGDKRLIPLGAFLRSSGLDELPQVFNVLRGDMSLVGPRPCTLNEFEDYLPWHKERFSAAPGLTGLWQVSGKNNTTFEEMIELDIRYAKERSLWVDLKIMLKTTPVLVREVNLMFKQRRAVKRGGGSKAGQKPRSKRPVAPQRERNGEQKRGYFDGRSTTKLRG